MAVQVGSPIGVPEETYGVFKEKSFGFRYGTITWESHSTPTCATKKSVANVFIEDNAQVEVFKKLAYPAACWLKLRSCPQMI